ncbi:GT4 family glycosyltransferase PelF [Deinococcus rubellus]|uniref:GT4 family glycosyltransferase PelF n=1 Tax=Deinococcus rubellus TaxID=1889240 RepID=UPI0031F13BFB
MQIALLCEGTYPHMQGGVSVWCDQLIAGLPEHQFQVYAISGQRVKTPSWTLPSNVQRLISVPLWDTAPKAAATLPRLGTGWARRGFYTQSELDDAYAQLLSSLFSLSEDSTGFLNALRRLFSYAQTGNLTRALTTRRNIALMYDLWRERGLPSQQQHVRRGPLLLRPSLADALQASTWLEHFLRPLSCPPPKAELCHSVSNGLSTLLAFTSKWTYGTPFIMTEHGIYLRERYLELRYSTYSAAFKSFLLRFYGLLTRSAYAMADYITPGSHYNERWEIQQGADASRIRPVYNGINPSFFPPALQEPSDPTITWVGRIDPLKDLETLIRAFGEVSEAMPNAKLRMFGAVPSGNEAYAEHCQRLIGQFGLTHKATFEGRIADVVDAYHAGHMVALSSISEGFPYTLIEAMASGRATVATDVGGVTEALGETGLIVPSRDHQAFARASLSLLGNDNLRRRLGAAARTRVFAEFTLENFLHVYRHVYPYVKLAHAQSAQDNLS